MMKAKLSLLLLATTAIFASSKENHEPFASEIVSTERKVISGSSNSSMAGVSDEEKPARDTTPPSAAALSKTESGNVSEEEGEDFPDPNDPDFWKDCEEVARRQHQWEMRRKMADPAWREDHGYRPKRL